MQGIADGAQISNMNVKYHSNKKRYDMGVVVDAPCRGMGYAIPTLKRMIDYAFIASINISCTLGRICMKNIFLGRLCETST